MNKVKKEFTEELDKKCSELIITFKKNPEDFEVRNELYLLLKDWMEIWIKSILSNWHRMESYEKILSLSWDSFYFSLKYYKLGNAIPSHFYNYARYFLLTYYAEKDSVKLPIEELKDIIALVPSTHHDKFEKMLTFFQLTEVIPEEHKIIWNDAAQSLCSRNREGVDNWSTKLGITQQTYKEMKRSFKEIIKFILKEK